MSNLPAMIDENGRASIDMCVATSHFVLVNLIKMKSKYVEKGKSLNSVRSSLLCLKNALEMETIKIKFQPNFYSRMLYPSYRECGDFT